MSYQNPKGTFDILPKQAEPWRSIEYWNYFESIARKTAHIFGFQEVRTPIFEKTELFTRSAGESSDIVSKEMYTFNDKGNRSMSLRPEGTAPIIRAFVNKSLHTTPFDKLFYMGPYFRYDRPQAGRFRQFHQFGAEIFGSDTPETDAEIIHMAYSLYNELGIKNLTLQLNSLGAPETRQLYEKKLIEFLQPHRGSLSEDSQKRLLENPLRILDSKDPKDKELIKEAPSILEVLDAPSEKHLSRLENILSDLNIACTIDGTLVRGLDYYNGSVFEISSDVLGAQSVIGAGGRYNGFTKAFGGPDIPGIGFATGIERILVTLEGQGKTPPQLRGPLLYIVPLAESDELFPLQARIRNAGFSCDVHRGSKKVKKALDQGASLGATYALILGEDELETKQCEVKNLETRESVPCTLDSLETTLQTLSDTNET